MYEDLREEAIKELKKNRAKKRAVYVLGFIFVSLSIILYVISLNFDPFVAFWIKFPMLVFAMVYGIVYFGTFGFPFLSDTNELTNEEIEREMVNIYKLKAKGNPDFEGTTEELELREIEELKNRWEDDEEYV